MLKDEVGFELDSLAAEPMDITAYLLKLIVLL